MKRLEWHDRKRSNDGRFARRDYSSRINLRCTEDLLDEIRRRAMEAEMEISAYVVSCLVNWWNTEGTIRDQLGRMKRFAPKIFAAAKFDAKIANLLEFYGLPPEEKRKLRSGKVTLVLKGREPPWEQKRSSQ